MIRPPPRPTLFPYTTLFRARRAAGRHIRSSPCRPWKGPAARTRSARAPPRSEEHTSELQSRVDLVCRLLLEKKKRGTHGARKGERRRRHQFEGRGFRLRDVR